MIRHRVVERIVNEFATAGELDRLVDQVLASEEMRRALERALSGPELRGALSSQSAGLASQVAAGLRHAADRLDQRGLARRAAALVADAVVIAIGTLVLGGAVGIVAWLAGGLRPHWLAGMLGGIAGAVVAAGYFTVFWSTVGQTPGMRMMRVRVVPDRADRRLTAGRALVRAVGLALAIAPCFLGFLPAVFDARRRGLPDYVARTVVVVDEDGAGDYLQRRDAPTANAP